MLIALVVSLTVLFWGGMLLLYYRSELRVWFDNRFGPDRVTKEEQLRKNEREERRQARWRWYN